MKRRIRPTLADLAPPPTAPATAPARVVARVAGADGARLRVSIGGGPAFPLPAASGRYVLGGPVWVALAGDGRPVAVVGGSRDVVPGESVVDVLPGLTM